MCTSTDERYTKRTENEKRTNDTRKRNERKRKQYEISVSLTDPGSV
jgi:hypothetical protein